MAKLGGFFYPKAGVFGLRTFVSSVDRTVAVAVGRGVASLDAAGARLRPDARVPGKNCTEGENSLADILSNGFREKSEAGATRKKVT